MTTTTTTKNWWVSWYDTRYGKWEYHGPWWVSGERCDDGAKTICAAVRAPTEEAAKRIIMDSHDAPKPGNLEWRFIEEQASDWNPYNDRFRKAGWMKWSLPT